RSRRSGEVDEQGLVRFDGGVAVDRDDDRLHGFAGVEREGSGVGHVVRSCGGGTVRGAELDGHRSGGGGGQGDGERDVDRAGVPFGDGDVVDGQGGGRSRHLVRAGPDQGERVVGEQPQLVRSPGGGGDHAPRRGPREGYVLEGPQPRRVVGRPHRVGRHPVHRRAAPVHRRVEGGARTHRRGRADQRHGRGGGEGGVSRDGQVARRITGPHAIVIERAPRQAGQALGVRENEAGVQGRRRSVGRREPI